MRKKLNFLLALCALALSALPLRAQSFVPGYYLLKVVRTGGTVYCDNSQVAQDVGYSLPQTYTMADLPYIFKIEKKNEDAYGWASYTFMNCKSKEYIATPARESTPLTTGDVSTAAEFTPMQTADGEYWGFYTSVEAEYYGQTYQMAAYLNSLENRSPYSLCVWRDSPDYDSGSCFTIERVDDTVAERLMSGTSPATGDLVSFSPVKGETYTVYANFVKGYMAGYGDVSAEVNEACEYAFESAGYTDDYLPTFYLRQVSTGNYVQHANLQGNDDTSDLGACLPHGAKATAATFTVVKAQTGATDPRAMSLSFTNGDYVFTDTQTHFEEIDGIQVEKFTYLVSFRNAMYLGCAATASDGYKDCNSFRIAKYDYRPVTPPSVEVEGGDDHSVELWGEATDTIAIRLDDYVLLIPDNMIASRNGGTVTLKNDSVITGAVVATPKVDANFPKFRTFKFNDKYNDILFEDAEGTVTDNHITVDVRSCIGKTLSPSFSVTDESVNVYHGSARQLSHQNRIRFDKVLTYTLAKPGYRILQATKTREEEWSTPSADGNLVKVNLTADMVSTNAPSGRGEGVENITDGSLGTYFHSTWTNDPTYTPLEYNRNNPGSTVWPYIDIHLTEPVRNIKWGYVTTFSNRVPMSITLLASNDGQNWTTKQTYDDLPLGDSEQFTSDAIDLGRDYTYLRLLLNSAAYKNYFCMRELYLWKVEATSGSSEPELITPAEYAFSTRPWGRDVSVQVNFATDLSTNVPRIDINLDYATLSDIHSNKTTYFTGQFSIDGGGVFEDFPATEVNMRGRGNSSWSQSKKPYRLKFNEKVKPFGLKKGKSWCLIAQAQKGSMLTNPIALRVASMTGSMGANHAIPVELYVNGSYIGSYMFTENPGFGNNSVDVDESNSYMIELDTYYDETYKFHDENYGMPTNIKEPDLTELTDAVLRSDIRKTIEGQFNAYTAAIHNEDGETVAKMTDVDSWSRFLLVNELVRNTELMHPKSVKLFRTDMYNENGKYSWGPVWDFDWAFGYQNSYSYYINSAETDFLSAINYKSGGRYGAMFCDMQNNSEALQADRYRVWHEFMTLYRDELIDYVDDYYKYAKPSFENNYTKWRDGNDYENNATYAKDWLKKRTDWVYANMPVYDLPGVSFGMGDVNEDGRVSVGDAICIINRIVGLPNDFFNAANADMNGDGAVTVADVQLLIRAILDAGSEEASVRAHMPQADATLTIQPFVTKPFAEAEVAVNLTTAELTAGLQMEVLLPAGATLTNVRTADALAPFRSRIADLGNGRYRVLLVAADGSRIEASDYNNLTLDITMGDIPADKNNRVVRLANVILASPEGTDLAVSGARAMFAEPTAVEGVSADEMTVRGGDDLTIEAVKDGTVEVYNLAGAVVARVRVSRGFTTVNLPMGIYIVAGQKVTID